MRQLQVSELRDGDCFYDADDSYKVYADPVMKDGILQVETTSSGDYVCWFKDGDVMLTYPPETNPMYGHSILHKLITPRFRV